MQTIELGTKRVHIFLPERRARLRLWTHMAPDEARLLFDAAGGAAAVFAADGHDWNADLSPWPAPACFKGGEAFAGRGPEHLRWLAQAVEAAERAADMPQDAPRALLGYSLAGLFALWAALETPLFDAAASVSGSLWYDGFEEYLRAHADRFSGRAFYFSLGDKEARTRNARLAPVQERTQAACALATSCGARALFELNPGNHFQDPAGRCARAVKWLLP